MLRLRLHWLRIEPTQATKAQPASAYAIQANSSSRSAKVEGVKFAGGSESLRKMEKNLQSLDFGLRLPENASPKLIRRGILICSSYTRGRAFTLLRVDSVHSVN